MSARMHFPILLFIGLSLASKRAEALNPKITRPTFIDTSRLATEMDYGREFLSKCGSSTYHRAMNASSINHPGGESISTTTVGEDGRIEVWSRRDGVYQSDSEVTNCLLQTGMAGDDLIPLTQFSTDESSETGMVRRRFSVEIPDDTNCRGGIDQNACMIRCVNNGTVSTIGSERCIAFSQSLTVQVPDQTVFSNSHQTKSVKRSPISHPNTFEKRSQTSRGIHERRAAASLQRRSPRPVDIPEIDFAESRLPSTLPENDDPKKFSPVNPDLQ